MSLLTRHELGARLRPLPAPPGASAGRTDEGRWPNVKKPPSRGRRLTSATLPLAEPPPVRSCRTTIRYDNRARSGAPTTYQLSRRSTAGGPLATPTYSLRVPTDQKVGGSSPSERAAHCQAL